MKKIDAVMNLIHEGMRTGSRKPVDYRRSLRSCEALGLDEAETNVVLYRLDYVDQDGTPYKWTQDKPRP